jgi:lipid-A-disaccharide synthase
MKYYIVAGEASGDLHGSNLVKELLRLDPGAVIRCWGGDKMKDAGAVLVKHYRELAFMGFVEVLMNLRTIFRNLAFCKADILAFEPGALVLIDYPGFNLRIARWAKKQGLKVIFYISPQVWAWNEGRVKGIKKHVDKMLVILPFEKEYFNQWDYSVDYVGHPLVQVIDEFRQQQLQHAVAVLPGEQSPLVALLPGSRKQEILKKLPIMLQVAASFPQYRFVVAKAPGLDDNFYADMLRPYDNVSSVINKTYPLLSEAKAALVTSGTATLETALFGVPEVVCYKGSPLSFQIARRLIRIKYISLVNLIMDKEVVKELIQDELTVANLRDELRQLLYDPVKQMGLQQDYAALRDLLSKGGNASANAARIIFEFVSAPR